MSNWWKDFVKRLKMSPAERYLAQAENRYDLEQRMKDLRLGNARLF